MIKVTISLLIEKLRRPKPQSAPPGWVRIAPSAEEESNIRKARKRYERR